MGEQHVIGKFCSVAKKDTIIFPKEIPGYITPEGQVLKEDGQRFNFIYDLIHYKINYNLDGGILEAEHKSSYTVEDEEYIPPIPHKEDNKFLGWVPEKISKGEIGEQTFTATWKPNPVLLPGPELREKLINLAGSANNIMAIQYAIEVPTNYVEISSNSTSIKASFSEGVIYIYSEEEIYCNMDMSSAFSELPILRDVSGLYRFICKKNTNINSLFKNCGMLSDVNAISNWADNGKFSDFTDALKGTMALSCLRVPDWYRWNVKTNYVSSTGITIYTSTDDRIPGDIIYPPTINGYKAETGGIEITSPDIEYGFVYSPIQYKIDYVLNGGEINNPKTEYTIEDETYYPPEAVKPGYKFDSWSPACIEKGQYGNTSFVANYKV